MKWSDYFDEMASSGVPRRSLRFVVFYSSLLNRYLIDIACEVQKYPSRTNHLSCPSPVPKYSFRIR